MVLETLLVAGRLQDRLEKIPKRGTVAGLLGQRIQIRPLPFERIQRIGSVGPFLIEVHAFPAIADLGPNLPTGVGPEYEDSHAPTVAARFIAIQLDKTIFAVGQRISDGNLHRPGLAGSQFREFLHKWCHGHGGIVARKPRCGSGEKEKGCGKKLEKVWRKGLATSDITMMISAMTVAQIEQRIE
jgi:hypothetical protein